MKRTRSALAFCAALACATPALAGDFRFASLRLSFPDGVYVAEVSELDTPSLDKQQRKLKIDCVDRCAHPVHFEERVGDIPSGILKLGDDSHLLYTVSVTGSSNRIRIYLVDGLKTRKVLETYSLGGEDIITSLPGRTIVRIYQYVSERSRKTVQRSWIWSNRSKQFHLASGGKGA